MYIESVNLKNFRNISNLKLQLHKGVNVLYGSNAQGKTNILEAIYLCAIGRSHRTRVDKELICFDKKDLFVKLLVKNRGRCDTIDVYLKRDEKKGIAVNNVPIKKLADLFGILHIVIFSPEDLDIIKTGPSTRRKFMDIQLCQISNVYFYNLQQYYRVLKQRNNLLKKIQKNKNMVDTLFAWDSQLVEFGKKIIIDRSDFIQKINAIAKNKHLVLSGGLENFSMIYSPNCQSLDFESRLKKNIDKDIYYGTTSVGPHKDDINFFINGNDVKIFGSQGQQRCAALSAKMSEVDLIKQEVGIYPVLLLDDVFSELDEFRSRYLLSDFKDIQIIITSTGIHNVLNEFVSKSNFFHIQNGQVIL